MKEKKKEKRGEKGEKGRKGRKERKVKKAHLYSRGFSPREGLRVRCLPLFGITNCAIISPRGRRSDARGARCSSARRSLLFRDDATSGPFPPCRRRTSSGIHLPTSVDSPVDHRFRPRVRENSGDERAKRKKKETRHHAAGGAKMADATCLCFPSFCNIIGDSFLAHLRSCGLRGGFSFNYFNLLRRLPSFASSPKGLLRSHFWHELALPGGAPVSTTNFVFMTTRRELPFRLRRSTLSCALRQSRAEATVTRRPATEPRLGRFRRRDDRSGESISYHGEFQLSDFSKAW